MRMRKKINAPPIPELNGLQDPVLKSILSPIKETIELREGRRAKDNLDKMVTWRELVELGLITESQVP